MLSVAHLNFFHYAYGDSTEEFIRLLHLPHDFIFHRDWFHKGGGRGIKDEYDKRKNRMSSSQKEELQKILCEKTKTSGLKKNDYECLVSDSTIDKAIRDVLWFYVSEYVAPKSKSDTSNVNTAVLGKLSEKADPALSGEEDYVEPPEKERVPDAGIFEYGDKKRSFTFQRK